MFWFRIDMPPKEPWLWHLKKHKTKIDDRIKIQEGLDRLVIVAPNQQEEMYQG